jgi:Flp pilus assembly protein TadD
MGDRAGALDGYRRALTIFEQLAKADPTNAKAQRDLAAIRRKLRTPGARG